MPLLLLLVLLVLCSPYEAASQRFAYQHYRQSNGLPAQQVRAVTKGKSGALWVGTDDGLFRFAGQDFTSYNSLLESHYVRAFAQKENGDLLFCNDTGIHLLVEEGDSARIEPLISASFTPNDSTLFYPNTLYYDQGEILWIGQPDGRLARWKDEQLEFLQIGASYQGPRGQAQYCFTETRGGLLLISDPQGQVFRYKREEDEFEPISTAANGRADALLIHAGQIWSGGDELRHFIFGRDRWQLNQSLGTPHGRITVLRPTADPDHLLVGTEEEGLFLYDAAMDTWQTVFGANDPHRIEELPLQHINEIVPDRQGDWWVCTAEGLGLLQQPFFSIVFGQANNSTVCLGTHPDGSILVSYGEVYRMTPEGDGFSSEVLPELEEGLVTSIVVMGGVVWLGSSRGELISLYREELTLQADLQERGGGIFFMEPDAAQNLWLCQAPDETPIVGVARYHESEGVAVYGPEEGLDNRILVVRQGPKERIYAAGIGVDTYLYRYDPKADRFINLSLPLTFSHSPTFEVHDMTIDAKGVVWLATTDGLLQYDLERIQRVDLGDFTADEIRSVEAGGDNQLWVATATEGVLYYEMDTRKLTRLDGSSGLPSIISAYRAMLQDAAGRIWLGTAEGVVYSKVDNPVPEVSPQPYWQDFLLNGRSIANGSDIRITPHDQLQLNWNTTAFSARLMQYRCRLQGAADSSWVSLGEDIQLELPILNPDKYVFELQALQAGGYQWSESLTVPIQVRKPWYERWWGLGLLLLGGVLVSTALFRSTIGALRLRLRVLNRQNTNLQSEKRMYQEQERMLKQNAVRNERQFNDLEHRLRGLQQLSEKNLHGLSSLEILESLGADLANLFGADLVELAWQEETQMIRKAYWRGPATYLTKEQELEDWPWAEGGRGQVESGQQEVGYPLMVVNPDEDTELSYLKIHLLSIAQQAFNLLLYRQAGGAFGERDEQFLKIAGRYLEEQLDQTLEK
ncbi:MAG: hypothetical protein AAFO02_00345 [Bacteroidota bacterium]